MSGLSQLVGSAAKLCAVRHASGSGQTQPAHLLAAPRRRQQAILRLTTACRTQRGALAVAHFGENDADVGADINQVLEDDEDEEEGAISEHEELEESTDLSNPAVVVLAGFYVEELPGVRHLLDQADGQHITLVPCLPEYLTQPLAAVLQLPEPAWEEPVPERWVDGGGWGRQRTVLFSGLAAHAQAVILELLEESQIGDICALAPGPDQAMQRLGDVLAAAVAAQRNRGKGIDFAAAGELEPVEQVVPAAEQRAASLASQAPAKEAYVELDDADLGLIDLLAAGGVLSEPALPQTAATPPQQHTPPAAASSSSAAPAEEGAAPAATLGLASSSRHPLGGSDAQGDGAVLPDMDQFILNKAQLQELAKESGIDINTLLAGLHQRGIELEG